MKTTIAKPKNLIVEVVMEDLNLTGPEIIKLLDIKKSAFYHVLRKQGKFAASQENFIRRLEQLTDQAHKTKYQSPEVNNVLSESVPHINVFLQLNLTKLAYALAKKQIALTNMEEAYQKDITAIHKLHYALQQDLACTSMQRILLEDKYTLLSIALQTNHPKHQAHMRLQIQLLQAEIAGLESLITT